MINPYLNTIPLGGNPFSRRGNAFPRRGVTFPRRGVALPGHGDTKPVGGKRADIREKNTSSNWGTGEARLGRTQYPRLREYMFAALVARTDIDFIAIDKGDITPRKAVDELIRTMEEYANYGFDYMQEKLEQNPNHFFSDTAFLRTFTSFLQKESAPAAETEEEEPDPL